MHQNDFDYGVISMHLHDNHVALYVKSNPLENFNLEGIQSIEKNMISDLKMLKM